MNLQRSPAAPQEPDSRGAPTGVESERDDDDRADGPIVQPYDPDKIDVVTRTPTVDLMLSRLRNGRIDLAPDFQRKAGIWSDSAQSKLIESLLLRIPLPTLYASEDEEERWLVVDGIQRLTSIARFVEPDVVSRKPLRLSRLEYLKQYDGFTFSDLPGRLQTRIRETELVVHLIRAGTPEEVKYNIFARINTGGLPLSAQELRHALVPGPARALLANLAASREFVRATDGSVRDDRMGDREMVLRYLAFRLSDPATYSHQDFDQFLRLSMVRLNALSDDQRAGLAEEFTRVMGVARAVFGRYAFRKLYRPNEARYPINKALFEAIAVNLAELDESERAVLRERKVEVVKAFRELMSDYQFDTAISQGTGDIRKVRLRFTAVGSMFDEVLSAH